MSPSSAGSVNRTAPAMPRSLQSQKAGPAANNNAYLRIFDLGASINTPIHREGNLSLKLDPGINQDLVVVLLSKTITSISNACKL